MGDGAIAIEEIKEQDGAVQIRLRQKCARWFHVIAGCALPLMIADFAVLLGIAGLIDRSDAPAGWGWIAALVAGGVAGFCLFIVLMVYVLVTAMKATISCDGRELLVRETGSLIRIPMSELRDLRMVVRKPRTAQLEPGGPLRSAFRMGPSVALEAAVAGGRIRLLKAWGDETLGQVLSELRRRFGTIPSCDPDAAETIAYADQLSRPPRRLFLIAGMVVALGFGLWGGWTIVPGMRSRSWPAADGRVTHARWEKDTSQEHVQYMAEINYEYSLGGVPFADDRIGFERGAEDDAVRDLIRAHPAGSTVRVFYDPQDPRQATLMTGVSWVPWLLIACGALTLATVSPLVRNRSTAAQDALLARYRESSSPKKSDETLPILRWREPDDPTGESTRAARNQAIIMAARSAAVCAIAVFAIRLRFARYTPQLPWDVFTWTFPLAGASMFLLIAAMLAMRSGKPIAGREFSIVEQGVMLPPGDRPLLSWIARDSFTVKEDSGEGRSLHLHGKDGYTRKVPLPAADDAASAVIAEVSKHLPQREPLPKYSPARQRDWIIGGLVTVISMVALAKILSGWPRFSHDHAANLELVLIVLGPGTWMAPFLWRQRAFAQIVSVCGMLNLLGVMLAMSVIVMLRLSALSTP